MVMHNGTQPRPCSACGVLVYDLEHVTSRMPSVIDAEADARGNILIHLEQGFYTVVPKSMRERMTPEAKAVLHFPHFATCPYASRFRKEKVKSDATDR